MLQCIFSFFNSIAMLYSKNQLLQWINLPSDYETLKTKLIAKVFEIEHGEFVRALPELVVLGKVLSVEKHPNADTLNVCQIDCGSHGNFQICTWGENVAEGQYVPVSLPGCYLPAIDLLIEPRKLRGLDSVGMICSKWELWINEDNGNHRIWDLWADIGCTDSMVWKSFKELFPWMENTVFEVESVAITNRPDLWGHFWLAVECRSVFSDFQTPPNPIYDTIKAAQEFTIDQLSVLPNNAALKQCSIETTKCSYYSLVKVDNIQNDKSEFRGRLSLLDLGHTPRFNRVDYGNWIMSNYSQPVHIFDADKISWAIKVTEAKGAELFTDLTGKEHTLIAWDIIIVDDKQVLWLAWIIWGLSSAYDEKTKNILIETANFEPIQIRKTATRLGLRTEASMRFEKWINPLWTAFFSHEQVSIITKNHEEHKTGEVSGFTYTAPKEFSNPELSFKLYDATVYFYGSWDKDIQVQITPILKLLGYEIISTDDDMVSVKAPIWRSDVTMIQDIYEDIARHIGLEHIPEIPSTIDIIKSPRSIIAFKYELAEKLISWLGMSQVESYPWYSEEWINILWLDKSNYFELLNPMDSSVPFMAQTLLPGLLEIAKKNYRQVLPIKIFEIGKVFWTKDNKPNETKMFAGLWLNKKTQDWNNDSFLLLKQITSLIELNFTTPTFNFKLSENKNFHPHKQAQILVDNTIIWFIGEIHPSLLETIKIGSEYSACYIAIELEKLFAVIHTKESAWYASLQDQVLTRDLSFEITTNLHFTSIIETIASHPQISDYKIFDLYQKEEAKSVSISIDILWDGTTTLEQINAILTEIIKKVETTGAKLKWAKLEHINQ